ncbi:MAG: hypothetical protein ACLPU9_05035 [Thermoplasmata archaeon]
MTEQRGAHEEDDSDDDRHQQLYGQRFLIASEKQDKNAEDYDPNENRKEKGAPIAPSNIGGGGFIGH